MTKVAIDVVAEVANATQGLDKVDSKLAGLQKTGTTTGSVMKGALAADVVQKGVEAIADSIGEAYQAVQQQGILANQTEAVLTSTGSAAGVTADAISSLADSIEAKSVIDAEAIQNGENLMLTFTNVKNAAGDGNDIFNQSIQTMTDMSQALGTDTTGAATMLGKALNDPIAGVSALSRVGVTFTDQQKNQIKALVESGDTLGAQKVILGELQKEFGGSAAAAGSTFTGAMKHVKDILDGVVEGGLKKLLPLVQEGAEWLGAHLPAALDTVGRYWDIFTEKTQPAADMLGKVIAWMKENPDVVQAFAITVGILGTAIGIATIAQWAWNVAMTANPIGLIIVGIGLLVAAIVWVVGHWDLVKQKIYDVLVWVGYKFFAFVDAVKTFFTQAATNAIDAIMYIPTKTGELLLRLPGMALDAGKDLVRGIINGIHWAENLLWDAASNLAGKAITAIKKTLGIASPSKVGVDIGQNFTGSQVLGMEALEPRLISTAARIAGRLSVAARPDTFSPTFADKAASPNAPTYYITVNVPPNADQVEVGRQLTQAIEAYERANGGRR